MTGLRWFIREVPRPRGIDDGMAFPPLSDMIPVRVLQHRERLNPLEVGHEPIWSEWTDVPIMWEKP